MQKTQTKPLTQPPPAEPKVPVKAGKIQVNFCKSPKCANFGIPAKNGPNTGSECLGAGRYLHPHCDRVQARRLQRADSEV